MTDYDIYKFSLKETVLYVCEGLLICALFAYVFFRSYIAFIFMLPVIFLVLKKKNKECKDKRKQALSLQFRELMNSVIASLQAGYSIENAFVNSYRDMLLLFGKGSLITRELAYINNSIRNNKNIEELLEDLGQRSHIDDIRDFAEIFKIAKRSGGELPVIIKRTADIIADKMEVKRKISTIISSKKTEQSIMNIVPFGIVLYIDASSPGFFDSLYHNVPGILIMTVVMIVYLTAYFLAEKIIDIKI